MTHPCGRINLSSSCSTVLPRRRMPMSSFSKPLVSLHRCGAGNAMLRVRGFLQAQTRATHYYEENQTLRQSVVVRASALQRCLRDVCDLSGLERASRTNLRFCGPSSGRGEPQRLAPIWSLDAVCASVAGGSRQAAADQFCNHA